MNNQQNNKKIGKRGMRDFLMIAIMILICVGIVILILNNGTKPDQLTYNDFSNYLEKSHIFP